MVGTWDLDVEAYPDTGFEGGIAIPATVGVEILAEPDSTTLQLADRSLVEVPSWSGQIELHGHTLPVEVVALGSRFLLGREALDRLEICFQFGREVRLRFPDELTPDNPG